LWQQLVDVAARRGRGGRRVCVLATGGRGGTAGLMMMTGERWYY